MVTNQRCPLLTLCPLTKSTVCIFAVALAPKIQKQWSSAARTATIEDGQAIVFPTLTAHRDSSPYSKVQKAHKKRFNFKQANQCWRHVEKTTAKHREYITQQTLTGLGFVLPCQTAAWETKTLLTTPPTYGGNRGSMSVSRRKICLVKRPMLTRNSILAFKQEF